jgi:predicted NAD/FAD-dependent oxidoreductase
MKFAIIGAGLSGITLAQLLKQHGQVDIFEKSKHVGGRMASITPDSYSFDFGTQFFKIKHDGFMSELKPLIHNGTLKHWDGRFVEFNQAVITNQRHWDEKMPHYVGSPTMNHIPRSLADGLNIHFETAIKRIQRQELWYLTDQNNQAHGPYDWVISTCPAPQASDIMPQEFIHHAVFDQIQMQSCFSLMLGFRQQHDIGFDAALIKGADISWISVNSSKPNRPNSLCLLVHATNKWSDQHFEQDREVTKQHLLSETQKHISLDVMQHDFCALHAWRYANMKKNPLQLLVDKNNQLAACGDWCLQGRIESAFISAVHTAETIIQTME